MPRIKQRTPELRRRVLEVAITTLKDDGLAGFTTRRVAARAHTSVPAIYELFGDKAGLLRAVVFAGFRMLGRQFAAVAETDDPLADVRSMIPVFRQFCVSNPALAGVMFARPFEDLGPVPHDRVGPPTVREILVDRVRRCVDAGLLAGDPIDITHVLFAMAQGLTIQEGGRWLGTSHTMVNRRWDLGIAAVLRGFAA